MSFRTEIVLFGFPSLSFRAIISNFCVEGKASNYTLQRVHFFINSTNCSAGTFSSESAPLKLCSLSSMYKANIFTNEAQADHI